MRDPVKVNRVIKLCEDWAKRTFPTWEEDCEFITLDAWAGGLRVVATGRRGSAGRESPHVKGLYFAGDQYGKRLWGGASTVLRCLR
jgi:hypothetical protein